MKAAYDDEVNALYIKLLDEPIQWTDDVTPTVKADMSSEALVVGLEILNFKSSELYKTVKSIVEKEKKGE